MNSRLKIFGMCVLLSGMAMARPQAQIQTGTTNARPPLNGATTPQINVPPGRQSPTNGPNRQPPTTKSSPTNANNGGTFRPLSPTAAKAVANDTSRPSATQPVVPQPQVQPQTPSPVLEPPKRLSELPPVQPKILFQNGLLTVQAPNSTLSDILNGIRTKAGIQFDGGQGATDRVAATFGPAPANEVLTDLLRGSRFDYVILGSNDGTDFVQKVILTPRAGTNAPAPVAAVQGQPQPQPQDAANAEGEEDNGGNEEQANAPAEVVQPPPQPQPQAQPEQQPSDQPKTTEQLLQELKQMQQQQQQQQGQQPNQEASPLKPGATVQPNTTTTTPPVRPKVPQ